MLTKNQRLFITHEIFDRTPDDVEKKNERCLTIEKFKIEAT